MNYNQPGPITLRPYQLAIGRAVLDSVRHGRGLSFTVEIARQGGKNELSAQLERTLLAGALATGGTGVKAAPAFDPQCHISIARLKARLTDLGLPWSAGHAYVVRLGRASQSFYSASRDANVVGATADLLLEIDEAQDVGGARARRSSTIPSFWPSPAPTASRRTPAGRASPMRKDW